MREDADYELDLREGGCGTVCAEVLTTLPAWFGIPEANADYAAAADRHPTIVAMIDDEVIGLTTLVNHSDASAEIHLIAVRPEHHRAGVGAAMLRFAESHLTAQGVRFLQVKTLAATSPDPNYAKTRRFYESMGFATLEVFPELWDPSNPALQLIKYLAPPSSNE